MDARGRASTAKNEYSLQELIDMYKKGTQLVSFGAIEHINLPNGKVLTLRKYPTGAVYIEKTHKNGTVQLERFNDAWIEKMNKALAEEARLNEIKESLKESSQPI